jgi:hypothetical protein
MQIEPGSRAIRGDQVLYLSWSVDNGPDTYGAQAELPNPTTPSAPPSTKATR